MNLSYTDKINAKLDAFDVKLKYFVNKKTRSGSSSKKISGSDFHDFVYATMSGSDKFWIDPATYGADYIGCDSNFAEIVVPFNGTFEQSLSDDTIDWTVSIDGIQQQEYLPNTGDQVFCFRKITGNLSASNITIPSDGLLMNVDFENQSLGKFGHELNNTTVGFITGCGYSGDGYWVSGSATNYMVNPSVEGNSGSYSCDYRSRLGKGIDARDIAYSGTYYYNWSTASGGAGFIVSCGCPNLTPYETYTVSAHIFPSPAYSTSNVNKAYLEVLDCKSTGASFAQYTTNNTSVMSGSGWQRHVITLVAGASHHHFDIRVRGGSACGDGEYYRVDGIQVEDGFEVTPYFDGSSGSGCAWIGASHASRSTKLANRNYFNPYGMSYEIGGLSFNANVKNISGSKYLWGGSNLGSYISGSKVYFINNGDAGSGINAGTGWATYKYRWNSSTSKRVFSVNDPQKEQSYTAASNVIGLGYNYDLSACYSNAIFDNFKIWAGEQDYGTSTTEEIVDLDQSVNNNWGLWWTGIVKDYSDKRNYTGVQRNITVGSISELLSEKDSPRIEITDSNAANQSATVEVSGTLSTPSIELENNEFVGALVNVDAANIVDGRLNTVWISQFAPSSSIEAVTPGDPLANGHFVVDEFFFKQTPGWKQSETWWVEILNPGPGDMSLDGPWGIQIFTYNTNETWSFLDARWFGGEPAPSPDEQSKFIVPQEGRFIICGNQEKFEEYTGGARFAEFVIEAPLSSPKKFADSDEEVTRYLQGKSTTLTDEIFNPNPNGGFFIISDLDKNRQIFDIIAWGSDMNDEDILAKAPTFLDTGTDNWVGPTLAPSALSTGRSWRRKPSGYDTKQASDFVVEEYPKPGEKFDARIYEWVKIELNELESYLDGDVAAGSGSIICDTVAGWPLSGSGLLDGSVFKYSSRTGTTLILSQNLLADHLDTTRVYPLDEEGVSMTGWPIDKITFERRPGTSKIRGVQVYTSKYPDRESGNSETWEADYEGAKVIYNNGTTEDNAAYSFSVPTIQSNGNPYWIHSIMVLIPSMWDYGRAKINSINCHLATMTAGTSSFETVEERRTTKVIKHLLENYCDVDTEKLLIECCGEINADSGKMQLAIAPIPEVFSNICKNSGLWIKYNVDGKIMLYPNKWWPKGRTYTVYPNSDWSTTSLSDNDIYVKVSDPYDFSFDGESIRSVLNITDKKSKVTGITLSATKPDGSPINTVTYPPSASGTSVIDVTDVVCSEAIVHDLARALLVKEQNQSTIDLSVKGVGSGFSPGQVYNVSISGSDFGRYLCERTRTSWSQDGNNEKQWETSLNMIKFR